MSDSSHPPRLSNAVLRQLPPRVRVPTYDRSRVTPGIVHIGVGGFHRAHQAVYLDDLLHEPGSEAFGLCGIGLLPADQRMRDVLRAQDYLYTVVTRSAAGDEPRVIGSIVDFLLAADGIEPIVERMAAPQTRIVSLTITEGGYCENKATGELDLAHPTIAHDLAHPDQPRGAYGFLAAALDRRRRRGEPSFTIQSCDNLLNNGHVCRRMLLSFLNHRDPELAAWVASEVAFPNSMVDRITPATTDDHRALVREGYGYVDEWPVVSEPFMQWVIEDHFPQGRPAWERVGAQLVADVEPYERMKIRLLNGSHQVMCYVGMLLGHRYAPQAMADADIAALIERFMAQEAAPLLPAVPGIDLVAYQQTLRERFANPAINDQLARIGTDGSVRVIEFVLPTIAGQLARGGPIDAGAFTVAAWIRFLRGLDESGSALPYVDALGEPLRDLARRGVTCASDLLGLDTLFGVIGRDQRFAKQVNGFLVEFSLQGVRDTLARLRSRH